MDYQPYNDSLTQLAESIMNDPRVMHDTIRTEGINRFFFRCHKIPVVQDSISYIITSGNWLDMTTARKNSSLQTYLFEKKIFTCGDDRCRKRLEDFLEKMLSDFKKAGSRVSEMTPMNYADNNAQILRTYIIDKNRKKETGDITVYLYRWKYRYLHSLYISCKVPLKR
jgi:hypothetical protein